MGWTVTQKTSRKQALNYELSGLTAHRVAWRGSVAYVAASTKDDPGTVFAIVALVEGVSTVAIKIMDESMGPFEDNCPATVFSLLTPTTSVYAQDWRKRVRARLDTTAKAKAIKSGDRIVFANEMSFGDEVSEQTFIFQKRSTFKRCCDMRTVIIPSWRSRHDWTHTDQEVAR